MAEILHHLRLVVFPIIYKVLYIPGGAGFLPSTVALKEPSPISPSCFSWRFPLDECSASRTIVTEFLRGGSLLFRIQSERRAIFITWVVTINIFEYTSPTDSPSN